LVARADVLFRLPGGEAYRQQELGFDVGGADAAHHRRGTMATVMIADAHGR
jgi:hypothetical protein